MAEMFTLNKTEIRLLDAGAGVGNLSAALCQRLLDSKDKYTLKIDAYENDKEILPILDNNLRLCVRTLIKQGHKASYSIISDDFVESNQEFLEMDESSYLSGKMYDCIISNPPYYKLGRETIQAKIMEKYTKGHPNIYALFMIIAAKMLKQNGELVFITPRSFCSGLYFNKFRKLFLQSVRIDQIHLFESRKDVFGIDNVLQENILLKATRSVEKAKEITITSSKNKRFDNCNKIMVKQTDIIFKKNGDTFIRIPTSNRNLGIQRIVDAFPNVLHDLNLEVSTGPVVHFRTKETISEAEHEKPSVPLLWAHNFNNFLIDLKRSKKGKHPFIKVNEKSESLLIPTKNYVLLKRFSSKEEKKRLQTAVLIRENFLYNYVGLENHLNFIYTPKGEMSKELAFGMAALLSSDLVDNFFRSLNGNTQVNAVEIRSLPLPPIEKIKEIGKKIIAINHMTDESINQVVLSTLNIDSKILKENGEKN